ncbi:SRPBCC family protein [Stenomitos frigidus]|uniref:Cyclase n=1 Tax=Stenomitos frigidus ULC18 TaxID=2107698 RepID=A0A2T1DYW9_9CYAN|nr:SRPBCC family protein [Stenomitos frigidus]PSB25696.1 cyclase [Stenomitos frigidus ULC18]
MTSTAPTLTRTPTLTTNVTNLLAKQWHGPHSQPLLNGEVLLKTQPHSAWGGAVTAQMYLPLERAIAWRQLTDYPRWVHFFPALTRSEILHPNDGRLCNREVPDGCKRLYQVASKAFLFLTAQVDIYLKVIETAQQQIQFRLESGSFHDFAADLTLQDYGAGTLLTYSVQATPTIPVPSMLIQQAIQMDLPANLRTMRQVLCR